MFHGRILRQLATPWVNAVSPACKSSVKEGHGEKRCPQSERGVGGAAPINRHPELAKDL
jgi:hypothetical protein